MATASSRSTTATTGSPARPSTACVLDSRRAAHRRHRPPQEHRAVAVRRPDAGAVRAAHAQAAGARPARVRPRHDDASQYRRQLHHAVVQQQQRDDAVEHAWVETSDGTNTVDARADPDRCRRQQRNALHRDRRSTAPRSPARSISSGLSAATLSYNYGYSGIDHGRNADGRSSPPTGSISSPSRRSPAAIADQRQSRADATAELQRRLTGRSPPMRRCASRPSHHSTDGRKHSASTMSASPATTTTQVPANDGTASPRPSPRMAPARRSPRMRRSPTPTAQRWSGADPADQRPVARRCCRSPARSRRDHLELRPVGGGRRSRSTSAVRRAWPPTRPRSSRCATRPLRKIRASRRAPSRSRSAMARRSSPVAIATVNVVAVNDAPAAVADAVFTNIVERQSS